MCTSEVENAVYVAAGNDPYELLEVRKISVKCRVNY